MIWFLKAPGLLLLLCASTAAGFMLARRLTLRAEKLRFAGMAMCTLKDKIRLDGGELPRLAAESFDGYGLIEITGDRIAVTQAGLEPGDAALLAEYFDSAGMADIDAECDRAALYITLIDRRHTAAEKKAGELCRLWRTAGFLGGVLICILLL